MRSSSGFSTLYFNVLRSELLFLEKRRIGLLKLLLLAAVVAIFGALVLLGLILQHTPNPQMLMLTLPFLIILAVLAYMFTDQYKPYVSIFKETIIRKLIQHLDENLTYFSKGFVREEKFIQSTLFLQQPDRFGGDDYVSGTLGQTNIEFSEIKAEIRQDNGKNKHWHTLFHGLFFVADFNKNFIGETVVVPDLAENTLGWVGNMIQSWNVMRNGDLVKLEDPVFEKLFAVYSTDQVEARYILTPALMQHITSFKKKCKKNIYLAFVDSQIFIAVNYNKNLFEPRFFRTLLDFEQMEDYYRELELAINIVDQLNLNTRIWGKS